MKKWKKQPKSNWLDNLDKHRINPVPKTLPLNKRRVGWKWGGPYYSDEGEDGILEYLFEYINDTNKFAVDIGSAHGYGGSHVRNLVDKYNWESLEIDSKAHRHRWTRHHPLVKNYNLKKYNATPIFQNEKVPKCIDLLSLDTDSMDWYVLDHLLRKGGYNFNVIILEHNPIFEWDESYVVQYDGKWWKDGTSRYGASSRAFQLLLKKYDMTLIHVTGRKTNSNNAIFISNKFITSKMNIKHISELHDKSWMENGKNKPNTDRNLTVKEIKKSNFIKRDDI